MRMKFPFVLTMLLTATLAMAADVVADYRIVPLPHEINKVEGSPFIIDENTVISFSSANDSLRRNAEQLQGYVKELSGIDMRIAQYKRIKKNDAGILLSINQKITHPEGYSLSVSGKNILIEASTKAGIFYAVQTLRKSIANGMATANEVKAERIEMPAVKINDEPRFAYRGMMLDCVRHFFPVSVVKDFIDMLALHNVNRFHWHLTDDQGWRIEIKHYPRLTEFGSQRTGTVIGLNSDVDDETPHGGFYTQEDIREVIAYAADRHIEIIPEIEMPGHAMAILACYPELGCTGGPYEVGHKWGVYYDVLCVGNEQVFTFVENVLDEVMELFPSKIIHIGGDETPTNRWNDCPKCKALGVESVQKYFTHRMCDYITSHGHKVIGWDEIAEAGVPDGTTIMSWRGTEPGVKAAGQGLDVVMSPTTYCYFDYYQYEDNRFEPSKTGECIDVEKVYSFEPLPDNVSAEARKHVIGVQANIWTEYIPTKKVLQYMALPRLAALAEVQWCEKGTKDFADFKRRLTLHSHLYDQCHWQYALHVWPERMVQDRWNQ